MTRTPEQNVRFHALVNKLGLDSQHKLELVMDVSVGEAKSSADLTVDEMDKLIKHLQHLVNATSDEQAAYKMRRKLFSLFHELRYETPNGSLDYVRINAWLLKFGYLHKLVADYTVKELPRLVTQVENMLIKRLTPNPSPKERGTPTLL